MTSLVVARWTIMAPIAARLSFGYVLGGVLVALCLAASFYLAARQDPYRAPAPAGVEEDRVRQLVLSAAPVERRYAGLFQYFADGFVRHANADRSRVQFAGARSFNGYSMDGLEGFARTGS